MRNVIIFCFAILLGGCSITIPIKWSTEREAFPGTSVANDISSGAAAYRQSVLNFSFADVFASAEKAMSFAQINVTSSEQASGTIYGSRSVLVKGFTKKFYYMLKVKEEGAEKCNVSVYSKQQESAKHIKWIPYVVLPSLAFAAVAFGTMSDYPSNAIGLAAVWPVIFVPLTAYMNGTANKSAALKWSPDDDEYLDRIMSFMRTDLLQK
jgi:hypothetical protein